MLSTGAYGAQDGITSDPLAEAEAMNQQAIGLYRQGKYRDAGPLALRALAILEKALGPDHPSVSNSLSNLAGLYQVQGRHAEAVEVVSPGVV